MGWLAVASTMANNYQHPQNVTFTLRVTRPINFLQSGSINLPYGKVMVLVSAIY